MDEETFRNPPLIGYFDVSNDFFAWRAPRPQQIERRRADLGDVLIFDILLSAGGIPEPDVLYPPSDVESLLRLLRAIESSSYDALKKDCLFYFLLKWHQDEREDKYAMERCIPPHFTALADAYWYLDSGINVPRAVSILADARLNRDYVSKILRAISLTPESTSLIVKYVRTAKPPLIEPADIDMYALALAESSLLEAWRFQRTFNETDPTRSRLLKKLIEWCIFPNPRRAALTVLLSLPLSPFEESTIHTYALHPQPQSQSLSTIPSNPTPTSAYSIAVLRDLICVRLIQAGKYADAIKIDYHFASTTLDEQAKSHSQAQDRRKMVQDVYAALPAAERWLLDAELEELKKGKGKGKPSLPNGITPGSHTNAAGDVDMSMSISQSWEEIPRPSQSMQPQVNGHASTPFRDHATPIPILERAGAPRFGGPLPQGISTRTPGPTTAHAPLIPISSSSSPAPGLNGSLSSSRKSFPPLLSTALASSTLTSGQQRSRQSHNPGKAAGGLLFGGGAGGAGFGVGSGSGSGLGASTSSGTGALASSLRVQPQVQPQPFVSAARQQNAFYQPPPPKVNGVKRTFGSGGEGNISAGAGVSGSATGGGDDDTEVNVDMDMDARHEAEHQRELDKGEHEQEDMDARRTSRGQDRSMDIDEGVTLPFSVFGNQDRDDIHISSGRTKSGGADRNGRPRTSMGEVGSGIMRRVPPGAFLSEEEEEEVEQARNEHVAGRLSVPPPSSVPARPTRSASMVPKHDTRASTRHQPHPTKEKDTVKAKSKPKVTNKSQNQNPGRRLPGALMDSDEDEAEQDYVAPLPARSASRPRRTRKGPTSVTSAGTSDAGEDSHDRDGVLQTRQTRRSTRLAESANVGGLSAGRKSPEVDKTSAGVGAGAKKKKSVKASASAATAARRKR